MNRTLLLAACGAWWLVGSLAAAEVATEPSHGQSAAAATEPVYVEPVSVDPWAHADPEEVLFVDRPPASETGGVAYELSPAQQDLGNLIPPGARPGFFQKLNVSGTWMPRFESDGVGISELNTNVVTALPFPKRHQPLTITPEYTVRFLDGPDFVDVPARLHDAELKFNHVRRISDRWVFNGGITLGTYADDHSFDASDAFRVTGRALALYESSPHSRWIVGVAYLNRANLSVVPAVGWLYWTDDLRIDVVLPQPKLAWRTWSEGPPGYNERWFYVQGDFGGGIWAVRRTSGATDTLNYSDLRVIVGTERKLVGGLSRRWEAGYVFNRDLEYDSPGSDFSIDDTLFLRGGVTY